MHRHCLPTLSCKVSSQNLDVGKWLAFGGYGKRFVQCSPPMLKRWLAMTTVGRGEGRSHRLLLWSSQIKICDEKIGWYMCNLRTLGCLTFRLALTQSAFIRKSSDFSSDGVKITTPYDRITINYLMQSKNRIKKCTDDSDNTKKTVLLFKKWLKKTKTVFPAHSKNS